MAESDRDTQRERWVWSIERKTDTCINILKDFLYNFYSPALLMISRDTVGGHSFTNVFNR